MRADIIGRTKTTPHAAGLLSLGGLEVSITASAGFLVPFDRIRAYRAGYVRPLASCRQSLLLQHRMYLGFGDRLRIRGGTTAQEVASTFAVMAAAMLAEACGGTAEAHRLAAR